MLDGASRLDPLDCNDVTSTVATFISHEPVSCRGPLDTSALMGTDEYYSIADMAFDTAMWPDMWGDVADSACARTAARSPSNEPIYPPSCPTTDVQSVCASAISGAAAQAKPQQCAWENIEVCTTVGSSPNPGVLSKSPSPAVARAHVDSADTAAPADVSAGQDCPGESVRTDPDDAPVAVHLEMRESPDEILSICVALDGQPYQSSTLVMGDLQDKHWLHDQ